MAELESALKNLKDQKTSNIRHYEAMNDRLKRAQGKDGDEAKQARQINLESMKTYVGGL